MVQLVPSVVDWTVYPVMAAPPLLVGAVHVRVACASPVTTLSSVGAEGVVAGVAALVGSDAVPAPTLLRAATRN